MYENVTYEAILDRMLSRISEGLDKRPSSLIYDAHSPAAIEFQTLYIELEYLVKNSYGDTAAREFLVRIAKDRGLIPEPATHAVLKGVFTPATVDVIGKRFNIGAMNYVVMDRIAPGEYQVKCETAGEMGNRYLGSMIPMEYIDGLQTAVLTEVLIPGEDEEGTEVFRKRYFDSFREQSFGGNKADYLATIRGIDGVGDCKVERVWNGNIRPADMIPSAAVTEWIHSVIGTVGGEVKKWLETVYNAAAGKKLTVGGTVYVSIVDSDDFGAASSTLVQKVQETLDPEQNAGEGNGLAPIGHVVNVESASPFPMDVKTSVTFKEGHDWINTGDAIRAAVKAYLLELRKEWAGISAVIVRVAQIETRILGVDGVIDVGGTTINGNAGNLALDPYQIPVLGEVSV